MPMVYINPGDVILSQAEYRTLVLTAAANLVTVTAARDQCLIDLDACLHP